MRQWDTRKRVRAERIAAGAPFADGKLVDAARLVDFLEAVLRPSDRVCLEGDNQKQADLLARALADTDPARIHDLHMVQSGVVLPEHLDLFDKGIAKRLDFSYSVHNRRGSRRCCSAARSSWARSTPISNCSRAISSI